MKHTNCTIKDCINFQRYCRIHASGSLKEPKPIAKESKKRAVINRRVYTPESKAFIKKNPLCKVKSPVCTIKAQHVHHLKGRIGDNLTDQRYWVASCDKCNCYIEQNDLWARQNGFKLSKFSPENKEAI